MIKLVPDQWQGYARAARLFLLARKFDASLTMVDMSLARIKPQNMKRRVEIEKLRGDVVEAKRAAGVQARLMQNHLGMLPVELLAEIFRLTVADDSAALVRTLQVCSHWRGVVLHTPSLWETLVLTHRAPVRKVRLWTKHSKGRIRDLQIKTGAVQHLDWPFRELEDVPWDKLRSCTVETWDIGKYLERLVTSVPNALTALEELTIEDTGHGTPAGPSLFSVLGASSIHSLTLVRANFSWQTASLHLRNLTFLKVIGCGSDPGTLLAVLEASPLLETFIMHASFVFKWPTPTSPLLFSKLMHVELEGSWASSLLENIAMPALQVLHVRGAGVDNVLLHPAHRSTNLKQLIVNNCSVTSFALVSFIQQMPSLETLELQSLPGVANHVVEALATIFSTARTSPLSQSSTSEGGGGIRCPMLTHLNVSHSPDVRTGSLVRLVKSRLPPPTSVEGDKPSDEIGSELPLRCSKLISLIIDDCDQVEVEWVPWLRKNVQNVSCIYHTKRKAAWKR